MSDKITGKEAGAIILAICQMLYDKVKVSSACIPIAEAVLANVIAGCAKEEQFIDELIDDDVEAIKKLAHALYKEEHYDEGRNEVFS